MTSQIPEPPGQAPANDNPLDHVLQPLTAREREILLGILDGESVKATARRLRVSPKTVEYHRTRAFEKTGLRTATEALATLGGRRGLVENPGAAPVTDLGAGRRADARQQPFATPAEPLSAGRWAAHHAGAAANLIAGLGYARQVDPTLITVIMAWTSCGEATGYLVLPRSLRNQLEEADYPATTEPMPIESALAYGLFLSLRSSVPLRLCGDATVWRDAWGPLAGAEMGAGPRIAALNQAEVRPG